MARDEGFERVGLDQVIARLLPVNRASSQVAQKIGLTFDREATGRHGEPLHVFLLDRDRWERQLRSAAAEQVSGGTVESSRKHH